MMKLHRFLPAILLFACFGCGTFQKPNSVSKLTGELIVFHAGSLSLPMRAAADSFMRKHPGVNILLEAAGSLECARKITELGKPCDLFASADYEVIDRLLIPEYASWNIAFASNEMALVYREGSRYASKINAGNWFEVILQPDVAYGRSDPDSDPCGYRTVMVSQLAEKFYQKPKLANRILSKDKRYMRPKEVDLLALLETGTVDYIFLYKSVAIQHRLPYISLPDEVNLSTVLLDSLYSTVLVELRGKTPGSTLIMRGEAMVYGLTIPKNSPNPELAIEFTSHFLSSNGGLAVLNNMGQKTIVPTNTATFESIPGPLKAFALKAK